MANAMDKTTKMSREHINQDHLDIKDQQRTEDSALDMMQGLHEHENHDPDEDE